MFSIGELDDNKNHVTVINALAELDCGDVYYMICGVGDKEAYLREQAEKKGIASRVILCGYRRDIPDIIHAADIFVFPSKHEGLPVSLMEAMAGGLPIICSDIRGNRDLIRDGDNGYLFRSEDVDELKMKLQKLLFDKEQQKEFQVKVQQEIIAYSQEKVVEELKEIYGK